MSFVTWGRILSENREDWTLITFLPFYQTTEKEKKKIHYTFVGKLTQNPAVSQKEPTQRAESPHMDTLVL